jgi:tetratricopeptide (TPR) repeat protein
MYTQLGLAYLDRAREAHDPVWLAKAREAEATALRLQDNFESLMAMAAIQNYAHRFADAITWCERAAAASVNGPWIPDPAVSAALVEAYVGLGRADEAGALITPPDATHPAFYSLVAYGKWLAATGQTTEAAAVFGNAADFSRDQGFPALAAWAESSAAGALLDARRLAEARPHIEAAETLDPCAPIVRVHRAELEELEGRHDAALAAYEALLHDSFDPVAAARAFRLAQRLGHHATAAGHFAVAERGLERAIAAGEVYSLGPLARLYADADRNLERALTLAEENLRWKRDREALATADFVRARVAAAR